jgi:hypothetical protein
VTHILMRLPRRAIIALAIIGVVAGCRDSKSLPAASAPTPSQVITPRASMSGGDAGEIVTLSLDVPADVGKIGSFTGRLIYDASALAYDGEVSLGDGTNRASNPGNGEIRVAGASMSGIDVTQLAAFRFKRIGTSIAVPPRFELEEVHELSRTNLAPRLSRSGTAKVPR